MLSPLALRQGLRLKRTAQRLPEAEGPRQGLVSAAGPGLRLLAVGESPLAGVGLDRQDQALTALLAQGLASVLDHSVSWQAAARGGVTVKRCLVELAPRLDPGPASLIIIGLGVNDSTRFRTPRRWQQGLAELITELRRRHGPAPVVLTGVPDMQRFPLLPEPLALILGLRSRLLDQAAADLAASLEQVYHAPLPLDAESPALFCEDGFHPNVEGHCQWAEQLVGFVVEREILGKRSTVRRKADRRPG
ncbi:MAG: SGNH/GDSL hydrolase family protein [Wenzhouxiangella sp.]|nr:SGNH/GDSL hydrolase family protein [Wenzhouxiangella sp.]